MSISNIYIYIYIYIYIIYLGQKPKICHKTDAPRHETTPPQWLQTAAFFIGAAAMTGEAGDGVDGATTHTGSAVPWHGG